MSRLLVWSGELISRRGLALRATTLLSPGVAWLAVFLAVPCLGLMAIAFLERGDQGGVAWRFTLGNFRRLAGYGILGWSPDYLMIVWRSVWMAAVTTAGCLLTAYPLAFFIAGRPPRRRYTWMALVVIPLCTNLVIRTYAWMLMLSSQMPIARVSAWLGLVEPGTPLYPGSTAVYLGMVTSFLPFAVLPLYANVERLDRGLIEAARDLYAGRWGVFRHAVLPQTWPGLAAAFVLTFVPAMGTFVVPDLLGGSKVMLVGNAIQQQFSASRDWPFGAALAMVLIVATLVGLTMLRLGRKEGP